MIKDVPSGNYIFKVGKVKNDLGEQYYTDKIKYFVESGNGKLVADGSLKNPYPEVEKHIAQIASFLAPASEHPEVPRAVKQLIEKRKEWFLEKINRETLLLDNEKVERDFFTYLNKPLGEWPEGTVVLQRITNLGELYYIIEDVNIDAVKGRMTLQKIKIPKESNAIRVDSVAANVLPVAVAAMAAKKLGMYLLTEIGGAVCDAVLADVFPSGAKQYFDEVYNRVVEFVRQRIIESRVVEINGAVNNIANSLKNEYLPSKKGKDLSNPSDRKSLFNLLQKYDMTFLSGPGGMLGTLMSPEYSKAGFQVFMLGAAIRLAVFQEMAVVDPDNKDASGKFRNALQSSYGRPREGTIAKTAVDYVNFAKPTWDQIIADRKSVIRIEYDRHCFPFDHGVMCRGIEILKDGNKEICRIEGQERDKRGRSHTRDQIEAEHRKYEPQAVAELTNSLQNPDSIIDNWRKLIDTPIKLS